MAATLTCLEPNPFGLSVASGPGDTGFVTLTARISGASLPYHPQFFTIDPAGSSTVETDLLQAVRTRVATDRSGIPFVFGDEVGGVGIAYIARTPSGWTQELASPPGDPTQYFLNGAAIASDGRALALFASNDTTSLFLATRAPSGGWARDTVSPSHLYSMSQGLALDAAGQAYVAYEVPGSGQVGLVYRKGTDPPVTVFSYAAMTASAKVDLAVPAGAAGSPPILSTELEVAAPSDRIHVFVSRGPSYIDIPARATALQASKGCEAAGCSGPGVSTSSCTETGDSTFPAAQALATTPDGAAFFAFTRQHVDRDTHFVLVPPPPPEGVPTCTKIIDSDRSKTELVLARVPVTSGTVLQEVFTLDVGNIGGSVELDLDARGQRLYLALLSSSGGRYLVFDTTKIP